MGGGGSLFKTNKQKKKNPNRVFYQKNREPWAMCLKKKGRKKKKKIQAGRTKMDKVSCWPKPVTPEREPFCSDARSLARSTAVFPAAAAAAGVKSQPLEAMLQKDPASTQEESSCSLHYAARPWVLLWEVGVNRGSGEEPASLTVGQSAVT